MYRIKVAEKSKNSKGQRPMKGFISTTVLLASFLTVMVNRGQAAIINGSFEQGPTISGDAQFVGAGSTVITGWTVTGHSVEVLGPPWLASDGQRAIDLSGYYAGGIQQSFSTVAGVTYWVTFDLSGNPAGGAQFKTVRVTIDSFQQDYSVDTANQTISTLIWHPIGFSFVASGTSATLSFTSLEGDCYGPLLDDVAVWPVPEPSSSLFAVATLVVFTAMHCCRRLVTWWPTRTGRNYSSPPFAAKAG
ncbi:choice-of-anchor C family protein [Fontisphaera persica]|uniref:choice-of-anchor C family protein n=1 Tax=Fontisphaera persica TaxID=2974023 RepID=UPI0024C04F3C|nr:choice-of-anchor C family protein [Fontisphaera persica]WCJ59512.1 choice-of-anchor C family protein [Fontisphaera persica]